MEIRPIRTEADHKAALAEIDRLERRDAPTAAEEDRLEVLYTLVEEYEDVHEPIPPPDPIEAIKFRMDQMGWTRRELEPLIGSRNRVAEVLNRTRPLSLTMIRRLAASGIPAEVLIQAPRKARSKTIRRRAAARSSRRR